MVVTNWLMMLRNRWAYYNCRRRDPQFRRMHRRRRPLSLPGTIELLEDRTLLSNVAFAVSGPSSITEDPGDGDNNTATYTISYTGDVASGESVSVDVAHTLNQTSNGDFTNTLSSAISAAVSGVSGVSFSGSTLSFTNSSSGGSPSAYAGTVTQASGGDATWSNISNAAGSTTGTYAEVTLDDHDEAATLRLTNFGFSIPTGATITGISVALTTTAPNSPRSGHSVKLTKNGTTVAGTTTTVTGTWATGSPTVGGSTNLWNTTWTPAEVNSSNFGLLIQLEGRNDDSTYRLDRAQVTVTYTGGGGAPTSLQFSLGVEDEDSTSESNEAYSIDLSNSARTGAGTTSISTSSASTTIVNLSNDVAFSISGPSSVTEDPADGDDNEAEYTISYTGPVAIGETVSVDVAHVLDDTTSADFSSTLAAAISAAASGASGVSFDGTTLSFTKSATSTASAYPGSASQSSTGDASWTNITDAIGNTPATYAQVELDKFDVSSQLRLINYGLNIPTGATVNGIVVTLTTTGSHQPDTLPGVTLTKNGTTTAASTGNYTGSWSGGSLVVGGATNLWGVSWTPAELNSSNFGIIVEIESGSANDIFRIYNAQVTVYYTGGGGSGPTSLTFSLPIVADSVAESAEDYSIELSNPDRTGSGTTSIATSSAQTTITNYVPPNQPPDAVNNSATTNENTPVFISVLANDTDPESDPLTLVSVTQPAHGTTEIRPNVSDAIWTEWITTGESNYATFDEFYDALYGNPATLTWGVRYAPASNYTGSDSFNYTIADSSSNQDTASVSLTVQPVVAFSISGPASITEDPNDSDSNLATYTLSYTGAVSANETISVDIAHALNQTTSSDFTGTLASAVNTAITGLSGVTFNGTTLSFSKGYASSGSGYAGTASQGTGGDEAWTNIANATGSTTNTLASIQLGNDDVGNQLRLTNFGLNIPSDATITGIQVILSTPSSDETENGHGVRITKNGTSGVGTTPTPTGFWNTGSMTFGGSSALWNTTWTPAELNSTNFGILIDIVGEAHGDQQNVDRAQIIVSYAVVYTPPTSIQFSLPVTADTLAESSESYSIQLSNAARTGSGAAAIATSSAQTTIINDVTRVQVPGSNGFTLNGVAVNDLAGSSVSGAGDVNGDGFDDVLVGAPGANAAYVVFGALAGFGSVIELSSLDGTNGFKLSGVSSGDLTGLSVAGAGDVNGDGFDDVIIGAPGATAGGDSQAGKTYVVFGASTLPAAIDLSALTGANGFSLNGIDANDQSGRTVSSAGDVNADGYADIIVGAGGTAGTANAGESYVIFGKASGFPSAIDLAGLNGTTGFRLTGIAAGDNLGASVSRAGDINADGYSDLIIGAPVGGASDQGEAYVVFGAASGFSATLDVSTLNGTNGFRLIGLDASDSAGISVSTAGDVNGDGFDDLIIGAKDAEHGDSSGAGEAYVVFGKASGYSATLDLSTLNGTTGFRIDGTDAADAAGLSVSSAGDFNGDGFDDLLVGAPGGDPVGVSAAGETYLIFGAASGFSATFSIASINGTNGLRLEGVAADDASGSTVAAAGDLNGDGFDDLIVGAPTADPGGRTSAGAGYVLFGRNVSGGAETQVGTTSANTLTANQGASARDVLLGGAGDDTLVSDGGADILRGGEGDDILAVPNATFTGRRVQGGSGVDTLRLDAAGVTLNLTTIPDNRLVDIEQIDIRGSGNNTLTLNLREVLNLSSHSNMLLVRANAGDTVNIGSGWTQQIAELHFGELFRVFTQGAGTLLVEAAAAIPELVRASSGDVTPDAIDVFLNPGQTSDHTVSLTFDEMQNLMADIVFVVDESGSMSTEQDWIGGMIDDLDASLAAAGITDARYALIGYESEGRQFAMSTNPTNYWGTAAQFATASNNLTTTQGGTEDGYDGIKKALDSLTFRSGASKHVILITDEDRDNTSPNLTYANILSAIQSADVTLHAIINGTINTTSQTTDALGIDGTAASDTAYFANGSGGFTAPASGGVAFSFPNEAVGTKSHYIDLAFAVGGTTWDLNKLRVGGNTAISFSSAFVSRLTNQITAEQVNLISSDPTVSIELLSETLTETGVTYNVRLSGQSTPKSFDLQFVRDISGTPTILGAIPTSITPYDILLTEDSNFHSPYEHTFAIPSGTQSLQVRFSSLDFDTADSVSIKDAFELALVDADGNPVVGTIGAGRDAFFNITEGLAPSLGSGVLYDDAYGVVTVDVRHVPAGTEVTLIARLVNNDDDTQTSVYIGPLPKLKQSSAFQAPTTSTPGLPTVLPSTVDFAHLHDVTDSLDITYQRTAFDESDEVLFAGASVANTGTYDVRGPLVAVVKNISQPHVWPIGYSGITPDGLPYFDLTTLVGDGVLEPSGSLSGWTLRFHNPDRVQFDYEIQFLAFLNTPPEIDSTPSTQGTVGVVYHYAAHAADAEQDALAWSLVSGPDGMTINAQTGALSWTPASGHAGQHPVVIQVVDEFGASDTQTYQLSVVEGVPNRAPMFTSIAVVDTYVGQPYAYQATAFDPDGDVLTYSVVSVAVDGQPEYTVTGFTIGASSGLVAWTPPSELYDQSLSIVLEVADGHGGLSRQAYTLVVHPDPLNRPPVIVSEPVTYFDVSDPGVALADIAYQYDVDAVDLDQDTLTYSLVSASVDGQPEYTITGMSIDAATGLLSWEPPLALAGETISIVVRAVDGKGGTDEQFYQLNLAADPYNSPPEIISTPLTTIALPDVTLGTTVGDVTPEYLALTLGPGESVIETLTLTFDPANPAFSADILFVVDESSSMTGEHDWLEQMVLELDEHLIARGVGGNRYSLFGYGNFSQTAGHFLTPDDHWGTAEEISAQTTSLVADGGTEDGYLAIDLALDNLTFRENVSTHVILITDENRDNTDSSLTRNVMQQRLIADGHLLHTIVDVIMDVRTDPEISEYDYAMGITALDSTGLAFFDGPDDTYTTSPIYSVTLEWGDTHSINADEHYSELAIAAGGTNWDVYMLYGGAASSFTNAFVDHLSLIASYDLELELYFTDSTVDYEILDQQSDGTSFTFTVQFTGDGLPHSFDVEFRNADASTFVAGVIPATIQNGYRYDVDAIDPDNDPLTYYLLGETHGATIDSVTGQLIWIPTALGDYTFTAVVTDARGGEDTQIWTVSVVDPAAGNSAPVITAVSPQTIERDQELSILLEATDADPDQLLWQLIHDPSQGVPVPEGVSIDRLTGELTWSPDSLDVGTHTIRVRVVDGRGGADILDISVTVIEPVVVLVNDPPTITSTPWPTAHLEYKYHYRLTASDPDFDTVTYRLTLGPDGAGIVPGTGHLVWAPGLDDVGTHTFVVQASDGQGGADTQVFEVTVLPGNVPPQFTSTPRTVTGTGVQWTYDADALDPNGDVLEYRLHPANLYQGMTIAADTGVINWTPTVAGWYLVSLAAIDPWGAMVVQEFGLTVSNNAPPAITSTPQGPAIVGEEWTYAVVATDSNSGDTVTLTLDADSLARGMVLETDDVLRWTPGMSGEFPITVTATDNHGAAVEQTFTLSVQPVIVPNSPPRITSQPTGPVVRDSEWQYQAVAVDPDGDTLTWSLDTSAIPSGAIGDLAIDPDTGLLTWTPETDGSFRIKVIVTDPSGAVSWQSFTVMVASNQAPGFVSIPGQIGDVGQQYTYVVATVDPDAGDTLTLTLDAASIARGMVLGSDNVLRWTPSTSGIYSVTLTVSDGEGGSTTQTYPLTIRAAGVPNGVPIITSEPQGPAVRDAEWRYHALANDPDGDELTWTLDTSEIPGGAIGDLDIDSTTGLITWTPAVNGNYEITVIATDPDDAWTSQTFSLTIISNTAPRITSTPGQYVVVGAEYSYAISALDPDLDDTVTLLLDSASIARGMVIGTDNVLRWTPSAIGVFNVSVTATDGDGAFSTQNYSLAVGAAGVPNAGPTITTDPTGPARRDVAWEYRAAATDPDGDALTWSLDTSAIPPAALGNLAIDSTGRVTWTPAVTGNFAMTVVAADPAGEESRQTFTLPVLANAPPQITSAPVLTVNAGATYTYNVEAADPNANDNFGLTFFLDEASLAAGLTIDENGVIEWEPSAPGEQLVTVSVKDPHGGVGQQEFTIDVIGTGTNDPPDINLDLRTEIALGQRLQHQFVATDDNNDPLTYSLVNAPAGMAVTPDGLLDWTPTTAQAGQSYTFTVQVTDGRVSQPVEATFTIDVVTQVVNHAPQFTTSPPTNLIAGTAFAYDADAIDPDGDTLVYSLVSGPPGLTINSANGRVRWTPAAAQLGEHTLSIRATDTLGLSAVQTVTLTVRGANRPPQLIAVPPTIAVVNQQYSFDFNATDPDGHTLTYSLGSATNATGTINLNAQSGELTWTPSATGLKTIQINVVDQHGLGIALVYQVDVRSTPPNNPPQITSTPTFSAEAGALYEYDVNATDPDPSTTITYSLIQPATLLSGMTFNTSNGMLEWTPDSSLIGQYIPIQVRASDGITGFNQSFTVLVTPPNVAPTITPVSDRTLTAGTSLALDVRATDSNGDRLTYTLDSTSLALGLMIDANGRIAWQPDSGDVAGSPHAVTVTVSDGRLSATDTFNLTVVADTADPTVSISFDRATAGVGETLRISVHAFDNVGVVARTLTLVSVTQGANTTTLNQILVLDAQGRASLTLLAAHIGTLTFAATAVDAAGNIGTAHSATILIADPTDASAPTAVIISPTDNQSITEPVNVYGTVADAQGIQSWTLKAIPADGGEPRLIASGTSAVTNGVLGQFDPTLLRNGRYTLELTVTDIGAHVARDTVTVEVSGALKLGNFTLGFVDLQVPVAGFPITVTRTYDTLNADVSGDFGYGWSLDLPNTRVTVTTASGSDPGLFGYTPFKDGARVVITLPDGTQQGFTFYGQPGTTFGSAILDYVPRFIPDYGVTSQLIVSGYSLQKEHSTGEYYDLESGRTYNPADPAFGGAYELKLRNGTSLLINAETGDLASIVDLAGNTLTFTGMGIEHSAGRSVQFERDYVGRIVALIDPAGKRITYEYDTDGNLIAVTDRIGATTQFTYLDGSVPTGLPTASASHYLDEIIDPLGRPAAKTEYDADGRIKTVTDADGRTIQYAWNAQSKVQFVTDQLGHVTTIETDARGNVIREVDPTGRTVYDNRGRVLASTDQYLEGTSDPVYGTMTVYDALGRAVKSTRLAGVQTSLVTGHSSLRARSSGTRKPSTTPPAACSSRSAPTGGRRRSSTTSSAGRWR